MEYKKHFMPLESDPDVFSQLAYELGLSPSLAFVDVPSLEPAYLPKSALAAILLFPTPDDYEIRRKKEAQEPHGTGGGDSGVVWYRQTINNACGLYGVLHALSNGPARHCLGQNSWIQRLLEMSEEKRTHELETSTWLEHVYKQAARSGTSRPPEHAEEDVNHHFVCFIASDGRLHELDGDRVGPIDRGPVREGDGVLGEAGLDAIRKSIETGRDKLGFSLMALMDQFDCGVQSASHT